MARQERDLELESVIAVYLIDLRAEYEAELRALTKMQRHFEEFRRASRDEERRQAFLLVCNALAALRTSNGSIDRALVDAATQLNSIAPAGETVPGAPSRSG